MCMLGHKVGRVPNLTDLPGSLLPFTAVHCSHVFFSFCSSLSLSHTRIRAIHTAPPHTYEREREEERHVQKWQDSLPDTGVVVP